MTKPAILSLCLLAFSLTFNGQSTWKLEGVGAHILGGSEHRGPIGFDWFNERTRGEIDLVIGDIILVGNMRAFNQGGVGADLLWTKDRKQEDSKWQQFLKADVNYHTVTSPFYSARNYVQTDDGLELYDASLSFYQQGISIAGACGVRYDLWKFKIGAAGLVRLARTLDSQINYTNRPVDAPLLVLYQTQSHKASNSTRVSGHVPLSIDFRFLERFEVGYTVEFGGGVDLSDTAGAELFATTMNQGVQLRILMGRE